MTMDQFTACPHCDRTGDFCHCGPTDKYIETIAKLREQLDTLTEAVTDLISTEARESEYTFEVILEAANVRAVQRVIELNNKERPN